MEQENIEIIILSPEYLDSCYLPAEHEGRFWLYRKDLEGKKKVVELWGKADGWHLLKNKHYRFPSEFQDSCRLSSQFQLFIHHEEDTFCLLYHQLPSKSGVHYELKKETCYSIGRGENSNIHIQDPTVSYHHAQLLYENQAWHIKDTNSRNGTYVNAKRITYQNLKPGDRIQIMQYLIIMGKDTLLITPEPSLKQSLKPCMPITHNTKAVIKQKVLPSAHLKIQVAPCVLEVEQPVNITESKKTPFLLTAGPSFTMGLSSMSMALFSLYQAKAQKQSLQSVLPTLIMSCSMALSMMLWPVVLHLYERHQLKKEKQKMETDYLAYLKGLQQKALSYMKQEAESRETLYVDHRMLIHMLEHQPWLLHERTPQKEAFLMVSMGNGDIEASIQMKSTKNPLFPPLDACWCAYQKLMDQSFLLPDQTICLDMKQHPRIGVLGKDDLCQRFLLDKLLQIFLLQQRSYIHICILMHTEDTLHYPIRTLPALFYGTHRLLVCEKEDGKEVDFALREWWKERNEEEYLVIFSFDRELEERLDCLSMLLREQHVLYVQAARTMQQLHLECELVLSLKGNDRIQIQHQIIKPSYTSSKEVQKVIQLYHCYEFVNKQKNGYPSHFTFLDMYQCGNVAQLRILQRWKKASTSLEACIGINEHEELIKLDLHEHFHGPHGLVAGMTGSGKSEWLITLILSLCVQYSPIDISFVLIDYKGGGMAQAFACLPHVAGILTNLEHEQIHRAIQGIRQELMRRQQLFRQCHQICKKNVMHIDQYRQLWKDGLVEEPLSHILIVTDEFAELKQQQPAFMEDLKQIARIGRSLGIHLLLATQKPSGVVDEQIWSNARFHVCLKVQDRMDSMEMLKKEDAIYLKDAGMFYLQIGYDERYVKGKAAWANAPYEERACYEKKTNQNLTVISSTGMILYEKELVASESEKKTQLEAIVEYIQTLASQHQLFSRKLWLPQLNAHISRQDLIEQYQDMQAIAEIDDPGNQRKLPLHFSLQELCHIAVVGSREEDKEMMLHAMLSAINIQEVQIYVLAQHSVSSNLLGIDDEILYHEEEKWESYLYILNQELDKRKRKKADHVIFSIFLHFEAFASSNNERKEALFQLAREGGSHGIYFCFMLQNPYILTYQMKSFLSTIYCFYLEESDSALGLFHANGTLKAGKQMGRGVLEKEQNLYQFQCIKAEPLSEKKRKRKEIPILPQRIMNQKKSGFVFVGLDVVSKQPVWISEKVPMLILCAFTFYEPFETMMKQSSSANFFNMKDIKGHLQEESIKKALMQGVVLWNGSGFSQACYTLNLPYLSDQGINERRGILWENGTYRIVQLVEEIENG